MLKQQLDVKNNKTDNSFYFSEPVANRTLSYLSKDESKTIVLRLIKNECKDCADSVLQKVKQLAKIVGKNKVAVWVDGKFTDEEFNMYRRIYSYDLNKFYHVRSSIKPLDFNGKSYYFILNERFKNEMQFIFYPDNTTPGNQVKYLKLVESIFL